MGQPADQEPPEGHERSNDTPGGSERSAASGAPDASGTPPAVSADWSPPYVYALGRIAPRFPSPALQKEFAHVAAESDTDGLTDRQALQAVLAQRGNRYLARQLCWILTIENLETYILIPRDPLDLDLLIDSVRPEPKRDDLDVVIGVRGPIAPPEVCGGAGLPVLAFDQIYSFDRDALIDAVPRPEGVPPEREAQFRTVAGEVFDRIVQIADNAGASEDHRALNYLAVRYSPIYATGIELYQQNASLTSVEVRTSRLSAARRIVDVVFSYTNRATDVTDQRFVRVDVTEEFPFLVSKMSPYYER